MGALRLPFRVCHALARGAGLALAFLAGAVSAQEITGASYGDPTTRYDHGILGDAVEWGALELELSGGSRRTFVLPETHVFEDTAPRLADLDGDGAPEVIVVETDMALGARLAVYGVSGLIAATPHIGRTHRWLAPVGAGDLDGDGLFEIAYVDRPHLARVLRVWRFEDGTLREVAALDGLTNHRIGDPGIAGGIRDCGDGPEMVMLDAGWSRVMAARMVSGRIEARAVSRDVSPAGIAAVLGCSG